MILEDKCTLPSWNDTLHQGFQKCNLIWSVQYISNQMQGLEVHNIGNTKPSRAPKLLTCNLSFHVENITVLSSSQLLYHAVLLFLFITASRQFVLPDHETKHIRPLAIHHMQNTLCEEIWTKSMIEIYRTRRICLCLWYETRFIFEKKMFKVRKACKLIKCISNKCLPFITNTSHFHIFATFPRRFPSVLAKDRSAAICTICKVLATPFHLLEAGAVIMRNNINGTKLGGAICMYSRLPLTKPPLKEGPFNKFQNTASLKFISKLKQLYVVFFSQSPVLVDWNKMDLNI